MKSSVQTHQDILRTVPCNSREALGRIVEYSKRHRLVKGQLRKGGRRCPIGIFFTDAQLDCLDAIVTETGPASAYPVCELPDVIGEDNFVAMTGLAPIEAAAIQFCNYEYGQAVVVRQIKEVLEGKSVTIGFCNSFDDLDAPNRYCYSE